MRMMKNYKQSLSKLSKDTNPHRKVIKKVNELRINIAGVVNRDEFGELETARQFWTQAHEQIVEIQKQLLEGKRLKKEQFTWMNTVHKMVRKRVISNDK